MKRNPNDAWIIYVRDDPVVLTRPGEVSSLIDPAICVEAANGGITLAVPVDSNADPGARERLDLALSKIEPARVAFNFGPVPDACTSERLEVNGWAGR